MAQTTKIYANSIAKYNEGKLLSEEKLRRLAEADFSDAVKMLCDYGYGDGVMRADSYDADTFISHETSRLIDFVLDDCPSPNTAAVLLAPFYYNNAKVYYKSRFVKKNVLGALYVFSDDFAAGILNGDYTDCPDVMADALKKLDETAAENGVDAKRIDFCLTRAMYADMRKNAAKSGGAVKKYVSAKIDFVNLTTVLRCKRMQLETSEMSRMLIEGGKIDLDTLIDSYNCDLTQFPDMFRDTEYYDALRPIAEKGFNYLPELESDSDAVMNGCFDTDLENMLSDAPFLHYFAARLSEFKKVKVILTCIKNGVREEIPRRVRWN